MSSFLPSSWREVVADASAIINLNATNRAGDILGMFPSPPVVTKPVWLELQAGSEQGHLDFQRLEALVLSGSYRIVEVGAGAALYEALIQGNAGETLDDGEAATIAYGVAYRCSALIDDRKARRICAQRFPSTTIVYTVELLLHRAVRDALGENVQADIVMRALQDARMRVPFALIPEVVNLIGEDRASQCPSLRGSARRAVPLPG